MKKEHIENAWTNETFRNQLSAEEQAKLPENPVGGVEMTEAEMKEIQGGLSLAAGKTSSSYSPLFCKPLVCSTILTCYRCLAIG